jgi:hypothetical protein
VARTHPLCSGLTPLFFSDLIEDHQAAVAVCRICPFQQRCLEKALARGETHGVWGAYVFGDQRRVKKEERVR